MTPTINLFLTAIVAGFGAGLGWFTASWLVGLGLARRMNCSIEKRWQAERNNTGPAPRYVGLVLKGAA